MLHLWSHRRTARHSHVRPGRTVDFFEFGIFDGDQYAVLARKSRQVLHGDERTFLLRRLEHLAHVLTKFELRDEQGVYKHPCGDNRSG